MHRSPATEEVARRMVNALVAERICYDARHYWLRNAQWRRLDTLCNQAMRVITGLPRYTPVEKLREHVQFNKIYDVVVERKVAHYECFNHFRQGRRIAEILYLCKAWNGVGGPPSPLPEVLPHWEDLADDVTGSKPMPKTRRKLDPNKIARIARALEKMVDARSESGADFLAAYVDAAFGDGIGSAASYFPSLNIGTSRTLPSGTSVLIGELEEILLALDILENKFQKKKPTEFRVYTDSQGALSELKKSLSLNGTATKIKKAIARLKEQRGTRINID